MKRNRASAWLWLVFLICVPSVQAQKIRVEYNKKQNFSGFKTYSWMKQGAHAYPFVALDIMGAVDVQLQSKGLTKATGNPDLLVNAYGGLDGAMNVSYDVNVYAMPGLDGPWWDEGNPGAIGHGSAAVFIDQGTLVIDIVERAAKKLRWRGVAKANLDPQQQEKSLETIEKAIVKMFRQYPAGQ
ncbi:MAG: DUF4136 domain-containing protein [Terriglobales bacterium]